MCVYLTLQLGHLQSVLYFWSISELGVDGDGGLPLPVFFVLFLKQNDIRTNQNKPGSNKTQTSSSLQMNFKVSVADVFRAVLLHKSTTVSVSSCDAGSAETC